MRGYGYKNIRAEIALIGKTLDDLRDYSKTRKGRLCWVCQKEKNPRGGTTKTWPGGQKFVCADCVKEREAKRDATTDRNV